MFKTVNAASSQQPCFSRQDVTLSFRKIKSEERLLRRQETIKKHGSKTADRERHSLFSKTPGFTLSSRKNKSGQRKLREQLKKIFFLVQTHAQQHRLFLLRTCVNTKEKNDQFSATSPKKAFFGRDLCFCLELAIRCSRTV